MSEGGKKEESLVLRDGEGKVYSIPLSELAKFEVKGETAAKNLMQAAGKPTGLDAKMLSGCVNRPCVNFNEDLR